MGRDVSGVTVWPWKEGWSCASAWCWWEPRLIAYDILCHKTQGRNEMCEGV